MRENTYVQKVLLSNYVLLRDMFSDTETARIYQCNKNDNMYMLEVTNIQEFFGADSSDIEDTDFASEYTTVLLEQEGIYYLDRDPKVRYIYTTDKGIEFYTVRYTAARNFLMNCWTSLCKGT